MKTPPYRFRALKTFTSPVTKSTYVADPRLSYTVRPGNDLLNSLVKKWVQNGDVEILDEFPKVSLGGSGIVK